MHDSFTGQHETIAPVTVGLDKWIFSQESHIFTKKDSYNLPNATQLLQGRLLHRHVTAGLDMLDESYYYES